MTSEANESTGQKKRSSGPLRLHREGQDIFVVGFGLWIPVASEEEGLGIIAELEDQGFRICS